jgi:hypothetical protein
MGSLAKLQFAVVKPKGEAMFILIVDTEEASFFNLKEFLGGGGLMKIRIHLLAFQLMKSKSFWKSLWSMIGD